MSVLAWSNDGIAHESILWVGRLKRLLAQQVWVRIPRRELVINKDCFNLYRMMGHKSVEFNSHSFHQFS